MIMNNHQYILLSFLNLHIFIRPSNDNAIAAKATINANANKSDNQNPKFDSFLRRSSAAFIGDLRRIKPGDING